MLGTSHKKGVSKGENMINWTGGSHTYSKICWDILINIQGVDTDLKKVM